MQGAEVHGYRDEEGVDPHSQTETYVAMRLKVDNWRWAGVPIYVRTGKYLPKRVTEVAMEFNRVPHLPFAMSQAEGLEPDALVLRIQPDEGITLRFGAKVPGQAFRVRSVSMDFFYGAAFLEETPEAYERLLLDALLGDPTLFIRSDEVAQAWRIVDPVLEAFDEGRPAPARATRRAPGDRARRTSCWTRRSQLAPTVMARAVTGTVRAVGDGHMGDRHYTADGTGHGENGPAVAADDARVVGGGERHGR